MPFKKQFLKTKPVCKVTFKINNELAKDAERVALVGEFNNWDPEASVMKKLKDGSFSASLELETGRDYQFRYLLNGEVWESDPEADRYEFSPFGDCHNSVISV